MTLAGGDPSKVTLRQFLDAAYALFIEEYQKIGGMTLFEATDRMSEWAAGGGPSDNRADDNPPPENTQGAMLEFNNALRGR